MLQQDNEDGHVYLSLLFHSCEARLSFTLASIIYRHSTFRYEVDVKNWVCHGYSLAGQTLGLLVYEGKAWFKVNDPVLGGFTVVAEICAR